MDIDLQKPLRLALIGMSGVGKTFWTRGLAASGYPAISCDDRIEEKLEEKLAAGGYEGIHGVAAWMGWPDSATYTEPAFAYIAEDVHTVDENRTELESTPGESLL